MHITFMNRLTQLEFVDIWFEYKRADNVNNLCTEWWQMWVFKQPGIVQTLAPGDPGKPGAPAGPTGPCRQKRNLHVRVQISSQNHKKETNGWIRDGVWISDTHRWASRTRQAIISTSTLRNKQKGVRCAFKVWWRDHKWRRCGEILVLNVHSLLIRRLQDAPSHQADHEGPMTEWEKLINYIKHNISWCFLIVLLLTIGPGAPFSPAEPVSPWQETQKMQII